MMSLKTNARRMAVVLLGVLGSVIAGSGAAMAQQEQQQMPDGWFKACTKQDEVDICNVQFMARADTGQLLSAVNLIEVKGQVNRRLVQIVVPTSRLIPPGIGLQINGGTAQKIDYAICLPDRCLAETQLTDDMVNSFKRGSELTLTSVNFQNQPNPIKITLSGFTAAYDGEPLRQDDINERQQKLEEFVNRNNEEFAEKLKQAQERAKAQ